MMESPAAAAAVIVSRRAVVGIISKHTGAGATKAEGHRGSGGPVT